MKRPQSSMHNKIYGLGLISKKRGVGEGKVQTKKGGVHGHEVLEASPDKGERDRAHPGCCLDKGAGRQFCTGKGP